MSLDRVPVHVGPSIPKLHKGRWMRELFGDNCRGDTGALSALICINIIFVLIGIIMIILGTVILGGERALTPYFENVLGGIDKLSADVSPDGEETVNSVEQIVHRILSLFTSIAIALVLVGFLIIFMSVLGVGTNKTCMSAYAVMVTVISVGHVIVFTCLATGSFNSLLQQEMLRGIHEEFISIGSLQKHTVTWNFVMLRYECCGLEGYTEFHKAEKWVRDVEIDKTPMYLETPIACCKVNGTFPKVKLISKDCASAPNDTTNNWKKGCWDSLVENLFSQAFVPAYWITGVLFLAEFICMVSSIYLVCKRNRIGPSRSQSIHLVAFGTTERRMSRGQGAAYVAPMETRKSVSSKPEQEAAFSDIAEKSKEKETEDAPAE